MKSKLNYYSIEYDFAKCQMFILVVGEKVKEFRSLVLSFVKLTFEDLTIFCYGLLSFFRRFETLIFVLK